MCAAFKGGSQSPAIGIYHMVREGEFTNNQSTNDGKGTLNGRNVQQNHLPECQAFSKEIRVVISGDTLLWDSRRKLDKPIN